MNLNAEEKNDIDLVERGSKQPSGQKALAKGPIVLPVLLALAMMIIILSGADLFYSVSGDTVSKTFSSKTYYTKTTSSHYSIYNDITALTVGCIIIALIIAVTVFFLVRNKWRTGIHDYIGLFGAILIPVTLFVVIMILGQSRDVEVIGELAFSYGTQFGGTTWYYVLCALALFFAVSLFFNIQLRKMDI